MRTAIANNKWYFSLGGSGIIGHSVDDDGYDDSPVLYCLDGWMDGLGWDPSVVQQHA